MAKDRKQKILHKIKTNIPLQSSQIIKLLSVLDLLQIAWLPKLIFNLNVWCQINTLFKHMVLRDFASI